MPNDERDHPFETKNQRKRRIRAEFAELSRYSGEANASLRCYLVGQTITATAFNWAIVWNAASFLTASPLLAMTLPWVLGGYVIVSGLRRVGQPSSKKNLFVFYDRDHCLDNIYDRPRSWASVPLRAFVTGARNGLANASLSPIYWWKSAAYRFDAYDPEYDFK